MFNIMITPRENPETTGYFLANLFFNSENKILDDVTLLEDVPSHFQNKDFYFYKKIIQGQTILMAKDDNRVVFIFGDDTFLSFDFENGGWVFHKNDPFYNRR